MTQQRKMGSVLSILFACSVIGCDGRNAETEKAIAAQEEAAERLGLPVEITNSVGMELRLIPAGEFLMGAPASVSDALPDEKPQHLVQITKPFYLGAYEVTRGDYKRVTRISRSSWTSSGDTTRLPIEHVSWDDAIDFCQKLSGLPEEKAAGLIYRLPTEAEWEYACRAGTNTPFHFGTACNGRQANCNGSERPYGTDRAGPNLTSTTEVGSYRPNSWGLYDMHGNLKELCQDWYGEDYYQTSPVDDPQGPTSGRSRVCRGGSTGSDPWLCRAARRDRFAPTGVTSAYHGFRVVAVVPPAK